MTLPPGYSFICKIESFRAIYMICEAALYSATVSPFSLTPLVSIKPFLTGLSASEPQPFFTEALPLLAMIVAELTLTVTSFVMSAGTGRLKPVPFWLYRLLPSHSMTAFDSG